MWLCLLVDWGCLGERKLKTCLVLCLGHTHDREVMNMDRHTTSHWTNFRTAHKWTMRDFFFCFSQKPKSRFTPEKISDQGENQSRLSSSPQIWRHTRTRVKEERKNVSHRWEFFWEGPCFTLRYCTLRLPLQKEEQLQSPWKTWRHRNRQSITLWSEPRRKQSMGAHPYHRGTRGAKKPFYLEQRGLRQPLAE